jgi:histone deacetylase complex regulatory component SIN3
MISKGKNSHAINYNILKFSETFVTSKYLFNTSREHRLNNFLDYQFGLLPFLKN